MVEAAAPAHGARGWDRPQAPDPGPQQWQSPPGAAGAEPNHQPRGWPQPRVLARRRAGIPWVPCWGNQLCHQTPSAATRTHTLAMGWGGTARHGTAPWCSAQQAALVTSYSHNKPQPELWGRCRRPQRVRSCSTAPGTPQLQPLGQRGASPARARGHSSGCLGCAGDEQKAAREVVLGGQHPKGGLEPKQSWWLRGSRAHPSPMCGERAPGGGGRQRDTKPHSGTPPDHTAGHHRHRNRAPLAVLPARPG